MTSLHPAAAGLDFIAEIALHSAGLADAAEGNLAAPVTSCPGWSVADLVDHVREVHWFWATIAAGRLTEPPAETSRPPRPDETELLSAFRAGARDLVQVLRAADPNDPAWTWAPGQQDVGFILRHQVQEAAVHHWDVAHAAGRSCDLGIPLSVDAIEEFLTFSVSTPEDHPERARPDLHGTLTLRASDAEAAWTITDADEPGTVRFERGLDSESPTVTAPASDLLLWLYRRVSLPSTDDGLVTRFQGLTFTD